MSEVIPENKIPKEEKTQKSTLLYILVGLLAILYPIIIASSTVRFLKPKAISQDLIFSSVSTNYVMTVLVVGIVLLALVIPFIYAIILAFLSKLTGPERKISVMMSWLWVLITQVISANLVLLLLNFNISANTYFVIEGIIASILLSVGYAFLLRKFAKTKQLPTLIVFTCVAVVNITIILLIPYL